MGFDFEEAFEIPGFWILGGVGIAMEVIGFVASKKMGLGAFPIWQLIILMAGTLLAAVFFSTQD
jgi:hypothetical protein